MDSLKRASNESQQKRSSLGSQDGLGARGNQESTENRNALERKASHAILGSHDIRRPSQERSRSGGLRISGSRDLQGIAGHTATNGSQEVRRSGSQDIGSNAATRGSQDERLRRNGSQDFEGKRGLTATNGSQDSRLGKSGSQDLEGISGHTATNGGQKVGRSGSQNLRSNGATNGSQDGRLRRNGSQDLEGTRGLTATNGKQDGRHGKSGSQEFGSNAVTNRSQDGGLRRNGSQDLEGTATKRGSQDSRRSLNNQEKGSTPEFQIKFYGHFAERVVSNLKDMKEKALAARWILFLERQPVTSVQAEYLKQLLVVCLHGRMAGVFADAPQEPLQPLPKHHTTDWLARQVSIQREKDQIDVQQDLSNDRAEYLAVQRIPYFGTHCFFAISDEPIENWENAPNEAEFPF